jgi:hypothetical protein
VIRSFAIAAAIAAALPYATEIRADSLVDTEFRVAQLDFETPEAAVSHFVKSIVKGDLASALQAFGTNEYADGYDFAKYSRRIGAIQPMMQPAPSEYPLFDHVNRIAVLARYAQQIQVLAYSLTPEIQIDQTQRLDSDDQITAFVTMVDPAKLARLTVVKAYRVVPVSDRYKGILAGQAEPLGANETAEIIILYELNGQYFKSGARLLRYGETWHIDWLNSVIAEVPASGAAVPTTAEEFDALIADPGKKKEWIFEQVAL